MAEQLREIRLENMSAVVRPDGAGQDLYAEQDGMSWRRLSTQVFPSDLIHTVWNFRRANSYPGCEFGVSVPIKDKITNPDGVVERDITYEANCFKYHDGAAVPTALWVGRRGGFENV